MNLKKLQQDRADAFNAAKALHDKAAVENRPLTAEEMAAYNGHMANVANLDANINIARQMLDAERTAPAVDAVVGQDLAENKPWETAGEFLSAVRKTALTHGRVTDPRISASAAIGQNETIDSEGGFLVPVEVADDLLKRTYETGQVVSRCDTIPMGTARLRIPRVDETSRKNGQRQGGISVYRIQEAGLYTPSKSKLDVLELNANKLIGMTVLTEELEMDANAAALDKWIFQAFPTEFSFRMDLEVIAGTGAGQFLGILTSGVTVVVSKDSGQAAGTVTTSNILGMWNRLWASSRQNAVWFINPDLEMQLMQLTLGANVAVELLYRPPGTMGNNNKYATLMGLPVVPIEQAAVAGTQGDIILADMSEYLIGERSALRSDSSIHVYFNTGQEAFRWMLRNDGQPKWKTPVTPFNGTTTRSPFVVLQSRT